ncbi:type II secretion system F family protein [bacterium]|nr:type II secretion system F family protein [bacterium]
MAQSAALGPRELVPVLVAAAIGLGVYALYSLFSARDARAEKRLDRFSRMTGGSDTHEQSSNSERLQELIEKAAPALAKPLTPQTEEEQSVLKIRLLNAGWRSEGAASIYLGIKFGFLLMGMLIALLIVVPTYGLTQKGMIYGFLVAGVSFYLPGVFVWWRVKGRQEQIFYGLPDALDLMVVCVEAGLGLDAAMRKVAEEMARSFPIISEEFSICNFQLQMGRPRREVLHDLGLRTGVDDMKSLAAILIQADRFGSSVANALRVQSDAMRTKRKQLAEERAAKTAVQLIIPLILFIFPAIFIVLVGPAGIQIVDNYMSMDVSGPK